jgi:hypothetical protein
VQRPNKDQVGPGQGPHACTTGTQVGDVAVVQGGQDGKQVHLLVRSQALCQWHSNLPTLLYLGAQGPERPMCGIMEHAWGWYK